MNCDYVVSRHTYTISVTSHTHTHIHASLYIMKNQYKNSPYGNTASYN